jgi:hypothetical protein
MALFIRPANVLKNTAATFTIDYTELAALSKVPAGYYKNTANWEKIFVKLKNKASRQKGVLVYEGGATNADLVVSETARAGDWELHSIIIQDYDRGEVSIGRQDIPSPTDFDFTVVSAATHGDLLIANGEEVIILPNSSKQYGDMIIEPGGTLRLGDGGGICEIEVLGNCIINGTILANNGLHTGGTWNKTSSLSESLSLVQVQPDGGNGGQAEEETVASANIITGGTFIPSGGALVPLDAPLVVGNTYNITITGTGNMHIADGANAGGASYEFDVPAGTYSFVATDPNVSVNPLSAVNPLVTVVAGTVITAGGIGGNDAFGNGGGGGRSARFGALDGGDAVLLFGGLGAGNAVAADEHGEDGADCIQAGECAGGGFRGSHGQGLWIKAYQIQGSGTVNASGQAGGQGGDGGEFLSGGLLWANGAGGGAAGGNGGKVWLRSKKGTPALTIQTDGGERGPRGLASADSIEAEHGIAGANGSSDIATY